MPQFHVSAPGKLILHGEHSVVYDSKAIACALNLRCHVTVAVLGENKETASRDCDVGIGVLLEDFNQFTHNFSMDQVRELALKFAGMTSEDDRRDLCGHWISEQCSDTSHSLQMSLSAFIYLFLLVFDGVALIPLRVEVRSDIPVGAGLGSSAAFGVSLSAAFLIASGALVPDSAAWSGEHLTRISLIAFKSEVMMHGKPSGIDNSISTFGGAIIFHRGTIRSMPTFPSLKVVLVNTKVPRSTKEIVAQVRIRFDADQGHYNGIFEEIGRIVDRAELVCGCQPAEMDQQQRSLVDYGEIGQLIRRNQELLAMIEVSHPKIDEVCAVFDGIGVPAKLTGAGGGGCVFGLLSGNETVDAGDVERQVRSRGFDAWITSVGAAGVQVKTV